MEYLKDFDVTINKTFSPAMKPTFVKAIVHLLLVLYAARIAPRLPRAVYDLFENQYFKLFIFSLILWTAQFSPSISILISLAFIMTVNYANQQPIWEFMENVGDKTALDAVQVLAEAAASPVASSPETIVPLANTAVSAVNTQEGVDAVKALAEQAMTPEAGDTGKIMSAVETVVVSTQTPSPVPTSTPTPTPVPTPTQAVEGIKLLAEAAASSTPVPPETIMPIANAVASAATSTVGVEAIKALAEQAMTPVAGVPEKVSEAVQVAVTSVVPVVETPAPVPAPAPTAAPVQSKEQELQPAPCYPIRRQDMSKVGSYEVGSYQDWKI